jgi:hypothetical protein
MDENLVSGDRVAKRWRRTRRALLLALALYATAPRAAEVNSSQAVNLDTPGAMDALARDNPAHSAKIRQIMDGLQERRDVEVPAWIRTSFDAQEVLYTPMVRTSYPPKKRLSFTLDGIHYSATITLKNTPPVRVPVK